MYFEREFTEFAVSRLSGFVGRAWLVKQVQTWFADIKSPRFLVLVGEPGIGKSAFLAHLWHVHMMPHAVHFCMGGRGGTTEPLGFVRNIVEQLANRLPRFAEALVKTQEDFADRNITIDSNVQTGDILPGGKVAGVIVHELHYHNLSPEQAFDRTLRRPLRFLLENQLIEPILIAIDALDESISYETIERSIVGLLTQANDLPEEVHFLLTTRPDSRILDSLDKFPRLLIDANSQDNRADIETYLHQCWGSDCQLRDVLGRWGWGKSQSIKQLESASEGNFLYLRQVLPLIASGQVPTSEALPNGLNEVYQYLLRRRIGGDRWGQWGADLLQIVLTLQEPASLEQICNIIKWPTQKTFNRLQLFAELFDPVLFKQAKYWRYHWSIVEFLKNRRLSGPYWCDITQGHSLVADHYLKAWGGLEAGLPELWSPAYLPPDSNYGLRHIVSHLEMARRHQDMHLLLGIETPDQRNLWHAVKDSAGDIDGYIFDISHAFTMCAEAIAAEQRDKLGQCTGLLCRYALIHSSINSLAKTVPPRLMLALVKKGLWSHEKGLTYISIGSYRDLERTYALTNLIPVLPSSLLEKARNVALALPYSWKAVPMYVLSKYTEDGGQVDEADNLREALYELAKNFYKLKGHIGTTYDYGLIEFSLLVSLLPAPFNRELTTELLRQLRALNRYYEGNGWEADDYWYKGLFRFITWLPIQSFNDEILSDITGKIDYFYRYHSNEVPIGAFVKIKHASSEVNWQHLLDQAGSFLDLAILACSVPDEELRKQALSAFIHKAEADMESRNILSDELTTFTQAFSWVTPLIPEYQRDFLLETILEYIKANWSDPNGFIAIDSLAMHLSSALLDKALKMTSVIRDNDAVDRASALGALNVMYLPRVPEHAFIDAEMLGSLIRSGYIRGDNEDFNTLFNCASYETILSLANNSEVLDSCYFGESFGKIIAYRMLEDDENLFTTGFWMYLDKRDMEMFITGVIKSNRVKELLELLTGVQGSYKEHPIRLKCDVISSFSTALIEGGKQLELLEATEALLKLVMTSGYDTDGKASFLRILVPVLTALSRRDISLEVTKQLLSEIDIPYYDALQEAVNILIPIMAELGEREEAIDMVKNWMNRKEEAVSKYMSEESWRSDEIFFARLLAGLGEAETLIERLQDIRTKPSKDLVELLSYHQLIALLEKVPQREELVRVILDRLIIGGYLSEVISGIKDVKLESWTISDLIQRIAPLASENQLRDVILLCESLDFVHDTDRKNHWGIILGSLARVGCCDEALKRADELIEKNPSWKWEFWPRLAPYFGERRQAEVLNALLCDTGGFEYGQEKVLLAMLPNLNKRLLPAFWDVYKVITGVDYKAELLAKASAAIEPVLLDELLNEILCLIASRDNYDRKKVLERILSKLSGSEKHMQNIMTMIDCINPAEDRIELLLLVKPFVSMNLLFKSIIKLLGHSDWVEESNFFSDRWNMKKWRELVSGIDKKRYTEQLIQVIPKMHVSAQETILSEIRILEFDLKVVKHYEFNKEIIEPIRAKFLDVITECRQLIRSDAIEKLSDCHTTLVALGGIPALLQLQYEIRRVHRWWP